MGNLSNSSGGFPALSKPEDNPTHQWLECRLLDNLQSCKPKFTSFHIQTAKFSNGKTQKFLSDANQLHGMYPKWTQLEESPRLSPNDHGKIAIVHCTSTMLMAIVPFLMVKERSLLVYAHRFQMNPPLLVCFLVSTTPSALTHQALLRFLGGSVLMAVLAQAVQNTAPPWSFGGNSWKIL